MLLFIIIHIHVLLHGGTTLRACSNGAVHATVGSGIRGWSKETVTAISRRACLAGSHLITWCAWFFNCAMGTLRTHTRTAFKSVTAATPNPATHLSLFTITTRLWNFTAFCTMPTIQSHELRLLPRRLPDTVVEPQQHTAPSKRSRHTWVGGMSTAARMMEAY
jgi:hypothetical protein